MHYTPFIKRLIKQPRRVLVGVLLLPILAYRYLISPMLPPACRFYPTCSCYAHEALKQHGVFLGSWLTIKRLSRCHPGGSSGKDPVPKKKTSLTTKKLSDG